MKYYAFLLKRDEISDPIKCGYGYIMENEDRLIETDVLIEVNTYDKGTTMVVYDNVVYSIFKDFVDLSNSRRIYLCKPNLNGAEQVKKPKEKESKKEETDESVTNENTEKPEEEKE